MKIGLLDFKFEKILSRIKLSKSVHCQKTDLEMFLILRISFKWDSLKSHFKLYISYEVSIIPWKYWKDSKYKSNSKKVINNLLKEWSCYGKSS